MDIQFYLNDRRRRIEQALSDHLPVEMNPPQRLPQAMRYAVLGGGKRLRALFVYTCGEAMGADLKILDVLACAIEYLHAYSLVHDDLPAMDDADLRRGQATCHKAFDEATAILVGDALQALAFQLLSHELLNTLHAAQRLKMLQILAQAAFAMVHGQMQDVQTTGKTLSLNELENIYRNKTGELFKAAIQIGLLAGKTTPSDALWNQFPNAVGLAFQIQDDILDVEATTKTLGKTANNDREQGKNAYPAIAGMAQAKQTVVTLYQTAKDCLKTLDEKAMPLCALIDLMEQRQF